MAAGGHGTKAVVAALLTSTATTAGAISAAVETGSVTLVAVAALAGSIVATTLLALIGGRRARRHADEQHPFGYGRERFFWSFAVGIVGSVLGATAAIERGVRAIDQPDALERPEWAWATLGGGVVLALLTVWAARRQGDHVRGRATWRRFVRHARVPSLPLVIVQQLGAIVGLLLGAGAVTAAELGDDPMWDGIGATAVGGVLALLAIVLIVEMRSLLIGEPASKKDVESIRAAVEIDPAVQQLIHMRAQHQGPEELLVGMKVELDHTLTFPEVSEVVNRIERNVRRAVPMARIMYIEPDVTDARRAAPTIDEHVPDHEVPSEIRAKQKLEDQRGALGVGIPVEHDL
jgi:cation diffusion facilitator family transporter